MGILNTDCTLASNRMVFELRRNREAYAVFRGDLEAGWGCTPTSCPR